MHGFKNTLLPHILFHLHFLYLKLKICLNSPHIIYRNNFISLNILISEIWLLLSLKCLCTLYSFCSLMYILNKDTFHYSERTVKNRSLCSLMMGQERDLNCDVRKVHKPVLLKYHSLGRALQSAMNFLPLENPLFILSFHLPILE